jgi:hypothetical protein
MPMKSEPVDSLTVDGAAYPLDRGVVVFRRNDFMPGMPGLLDWEMAVTAKAEHHLAGDEHAVEFMAGGRTFSGLATLASQSSGNQHRFRGTGPLDGLSAVEF